MVPILNDVSPLKNLLLARLHVSGLPARSYNSVFWQKFIFQPKLLLFPLTRSLCYSQQHDRQKFVNGCFSCYCICARGIVKRVGVLWAPQTHSRVLLWFFSLLLRWLCCMLWVCRLPEGAFHGPALANQQQRQGGKAICSAGIVPSCALLQQLKTGKWST